MDALPEPPPDDEQVILQKLAYCGLALRGVTVLYEDYLQGYEIVVGPQSEATNEMFDCIRKATSGEIVTFADIELTRQYQDFLWELSRPLVLESAEAELARQGRLDGFPKRRMFPSDALFAEALETHCGLARGEAIRPFGHRLAFQPPLEDVRDIEAFMKKYSCLLSAMQFVAAKGEVEIGWIGNEAVAPSD